MVSISSWNGLEYSLTVVKDSQLIRAQFLIDECCCLSFCFVSRRDDLLIPVPSITYCNFYYECVKWYNLLIFLVSTFY